MEDAVAAEVLGEVGRDHRIEGLIGTDGERVFELVELGRSIPAGILGGIALVDAEPVRLRRSGVLVAAGPHEHGQPPVMEGAPYGAPDRGSADQQHPTRTCARDSERARDGPPAEAVDERGGDDHDEGDRNRFLCPAADPGLGEAEGERGGGRSGTHRH